MHVARLAALGTILLATVVAAQERTSPPQPSVADLEKMRLMEETISAAEQLERSVESVGIDFQYQCLKAVGHTGFCQCLRETRPWSVTFLDYVRIVTAPAEQIQSPKLNRDTREIVENIIKAREHCVKNHFATKASRK